MTPLLVAVVGATATGKSALGLALAEAADGEVINADSMQLYRGMDIGTAKLTELERRGIPHHLLDIWDVRESAAVEEYQRLARARIAEVHAAGRAAVLVGGSGLYVRAVLDDLRFPGTDPRLRAQLEAEAETGELGRLHERLADLDPEAAARILPGNTRRIVRALEVIELTGGRFTATLPEPRYLQPALQVGLRIERPELDRRITERVDDMWSAGLVTEVEQLVQAGLREGRTASRALGYAQVLDMLEGRCSPDEARQATVAATRKFARRQERWFGRDPRVHWLDATRPDLLDATLALVAAGHPGPTNPALRPADRSLSALDQPDASNFGGVLRRLGGDD
ncbi:MAG TPA: tRNA (adenosine(37)-N6)-dimethylallyltransferase MiaA [Sporichthyaceae bacterium]|nr:tRNA (adenosine(37)-N6)-dimethylallyltransferase MiaA [Sporichthyaceae bacterium]